MLRLIFNRCFAEETPRQINVWWHYSWFMEFLIWIGKGDEQIYLLSFPDLNCIFRINGQYYRRRNISLVISLWRLQRAMYFSRLS